MPKQEKDTEASEKPAASPKKSAGLLKLLLLTAPLMVLSAVASAAAVHYLLTGLLIPQFFGPANPLAELKPVVYYPLERLNANMGSNSPARFLRLHVTLVSREEPVIAAVQRHLPAIRNDLLNHLAEQDFATLNRPSGKDQLRQEVLDIVTAILVRMGEPTGIEQVLFTDLIMQ